MKYLINRRRDMNAVSQGHFELEVEGISGWAVNAEGWQAEEQRMGGVAYA